MLSKNPNRMAPHVSVPALGPVLSNTNPFQRSHGGSRALRDRFKITHLGKKLKLHSGLPGLTCLCGQSKMGLGTA